MEVFSETMFDLGRDSGLSLISISSCVGTMDVSKLVNFFDKDGNHDVL
jgi:hypothetical protein